MENLFLRTADIIQIGLLVCVVIQIVFASKHFSENQKLAGKSMRADHDRRKKQATFEFINSVSDRYKEAIKIFDDRHGTDIVVDISKFDDKDRFTVKSYLNEIERICAGVNAEVFDFDILNKMMGRNLLSSNKRFRQYIDNVQSRSKSYYVEFDQVAKKLEAARSGEYKNVGQIVHE